MNTSFTRLSFYILVLCLAGCEFDIHNYHHAKVGKCPETTSVTEATPFGEFVLGFADYGNNARQFELVRESGSKWMRIDLGWNVDEPYLTQANIPRAEIKKHPYLIDEYSKKLDWDRFDQRLSWAKDNKINLIAIVGHGYRFHLPSYRLQDGEDGGRISPDVIGAQEYLDRMYLQVRAVVRRYKSSINVWQLENELNVARQTALWGWRDPMGLSAMKKTLWGDVNFLTQLMKTLSQAVKDEDPNAWRTHNFQMDIHARIMHRLGMPDVNEAIELWRDYLDLIGLDTYPNYYDANLKWQEQFTKQMKDIRRVACGRPIAILETNYPAAPNARGFTPEKQESYFNSILYLSQENHLAALFMYGGVSISNREDNFKFTRKGQKNLKKLGHLFHEGRVVSLLLWALFHQKDLKSPRLIQDLTSVEYFWDFFDESNQPRPAWNQILQFNSRTQIIRRHVPKD